MNKDEIGTVNPILEELAREGRIKMMVGSVGLRVEYKVEEIL